MANEPIFQGDADMLYVHDGTQYRPIACLTSNTLDKTRNFRERTTKCNAGEVERVPSGITRSITLEGLFFDTTSEGGDTARASYDWLDEKIESGEELTIKNEIVSLNGIDGSDPVYYTAYLESLSRTSPSGEDITFSATLNVSGAGTKVDPKA